MQLKLTSDAQTRMQETLRILLSPLDYEQIDAWRSDVCRTVRTLFGADAVTFGLPIRTDLPYYSEDFDLQEINRYPGELEPLDARFHVWARARRLKVFDRRTLWQPHLEEYYRSAYYNEYVVVMRAYDNLSMVAPLDAREHWRGTAQIMLHHNRPNGPRFGERGLALLRLLYPAFYSGTQHLLRFHHRMEILSRLLDGLREAVLLCDRTGRVVHRNVALEVMLREEPERERLLQEMTALARAFAEAANGAAGVDPGVVASVRDVRTRTDDYRIHGSYTGEEHVDCAGCVLVVLERYRPELPPPNILRERFGLTRREGEVALLLTRRKHNDEIAEALCISPHTARHHTENVLAKLGLHSRDDVGRAVAGRADGVRPEAGLPGTAAAFWGGSS